MFSKIVGKLAEKIDPSILEKSKKPNDSNADSAPASSATLPGNQKPEQDAGNTAPAPAPAADKKPDANKKPDNPATKAPSGDYKGPAGEYGGKLAEQIGFLKAHKLYYPVILLASMAVLYFVWRPAFVVLLFTALGTASRLYQRFLRGMSLGVETIIFGAAIVGKLYGAWPAALIGLVALPLSIVYTEEEVKWLPVAMGGMVLVGLLAAYLPAAFPAMSILTTGIILTLAYDISTCSVYIFVFHARFFTTAIFIGTHLAFNYFLFSHFGQTVLNLLA